MTLSRRLVFNNLRIINLHGHSINHNASSNTRKEGIRGVQTGSLATGSPIKGKRYKKGSRKGRRRESGKRHRKGRKGKREKGGKEIGERPEMMKEKRGKEGLRNVSITEEL